MIIDTIRAEQGENGSRIQSDVRFEGEEARTETVFFECDDTLVSPDASSLLLSAYLPAWAAGERRIRLDQSVCPVLIANILIATEIIAGWYPDLSTPPEIEAEKEYCPAASDVAVFMSGGVDSVASLHSLTTTYPLGHANRPQAAILIDYQGIKGASREQTDARFYRRMKSCRAICDEAGVDLVTIRTNVRCLNNDRQFWMYRYHGSVLAAVAHALSTRFRQVYIASSQHVSYLTPWGSQPLLDPFLSSHHVRICHHGIEMTRLEKLRTIVDMQAAVNHMHVCVLKTEDGRNCGFCEKCVRTMLQLLSLKSLSSVSAFEERDVSSTDLLAIQIRSKYGYACYAEVMPYLQALGRQDLVSAVEEIMFNYRRRFINLTRYFYQGKALASRVARKLGV